MTRIDVYRIDWFWPKQYGWRLRLSNLHRPWQAENDTLRWARRGWTAKHAERRIARDLMRGRWDCGQDHAPMAHLERVLRRFAPQIIEPNALAVSTEEQP